MESEAILFFALESSFLALELESNCLKAESVLRAQTCQRPYLSVETIPDERLNLAEGKLAFQSSTEVHDDMQHNASLATDGSTSIHEETCSMTGT